MNVQFRSIDHMRPIQFKKIVLYIGCLTAGLTLWVLSFSDSALSCDVAVISGRVTVSGRPIIWKNRDHSDAWQQELIYYEAVKPEVGGSMRIMDRETTSFIEEDSDSETFLTAPIMSGGMNESGFAITNTTVYEWNPIDEFFNANVPLMEDALEQCKTVAEFEDMVVDYKKNPMNWDKIISGNFVVLDASGGAALYALYSGDYGFISPIQATKYDANDTEDAPHGFVNLTNSNVYLERNSDTRREERGREILESLYQKSSLSLENIVKTLAKDVCGDDILPDGTLPTLDPVNNDPENFNTNECISRYLTNFSMVVEGVKPAENPAFTTLWLNMGEPAVGVSTPHFAGARKVTPYAWAESELEAESPVNSTTTCALNQMINDQELAMYDNNISPDIFTPMDLTINYDVLLDIQSWTIPLEKTVIENTAILIDQYRKGILPQGKSLEEALYDLSHYTAGYAYDNFTHQSDSFEAWDFGDLSAGIDPNNDFSSFSRFMIWLIGILRMF